MSEIEIKQLKNFLKKSGKTFREFSLDSRHKMLIQEDGCRIFGSIYFGFFSSSYMDQQQIS